MHCAAKRLCSVVKAETLLNFCGHSGKDNKENSVERIQVERLPFQSANRTRNRIRFSFSTKTGLIKQSEQGKSAKQIFNFGIKVGSWVAVSGPTRQRRRGLCGFGWWSDGRQLLEGRVPICSVCGVWDGPRYLKRQLGTYEDQESPTV